MTTIQELAVLRKEIEEVKAVMKSELDNFQAAPFWVDLQTRRAGIEEAIRLAEEVIRDEAITAYKADETKKKGPGVTVKIFTTVEIIDEGAALQWCKQNFTPALKLNTAMFEKAAKAGTIPAELAKVDTEPRAQIDSDLSKFLEG